MLRRICFVLSLLFAPAAFAGSLCDDFARSAVKTQYLPQSAPVLDRAERKLEALAMANLPVTITGQSEVFQDGKPLYQDTRIPVKFTQEQLNSLGMSDTNTDAAGTHASGMYYQLHFIRDQPYRARKNSAYSLNTRPAIDSISVIRPGNPQTGFTVHFQLAMAQPDAPKSDVGTCIPQSLIRLGPIMHPGNILQQVSVYDFDACNRYASVFAGRTMHLGSTIRPVDDCRMIDSKRPQGVLYKSCGDAMSEVVGSIGKDRWTSLEGILVPGVSDRPPAEQLSLAVEHWKDRCSVEGEPDGTISSDGAEVATQHLISSSVQAYGRHLHYMSGAPVPVDAYGRPAQ